MLMNDKIIFDHYYCIIIFDCYYCINSVRTKKIKLHYILQPHHVFIRVKVFIRMLFPGELQLLIISTCFAWHPVTSINKSHVLTACALDNCYINTWLYGC